MILSMNLNMRKNIFRSNFRNDLYAESFLINSWAMITPEQEQKLKELSAEHNKRQIAKLMGVSEDWVKWNCRKLKIKTARPTHMRARVTLNTIALFAIQNGVIEACNEYKLTKSNIKRIVSDFRNRSEKNNTEAKAEILQKLRVSATRYASTKERYSEAEDFASWCVMRQLMGVNVFIKHAWKDYLGECFGRKNRKKGAAKMLAMHTAISLDTIGNSFDEFDNPNAIQIGVSEEKLIEIIDLCAFKDLRVRVICLLILVYGMTNIEIGTVVGLTPSRVWQLFSGAKEEIKLRLNK